VAINGTLQQVHPVWSEGHWSLLLIQPMDLSNDKSCTINGEGYAM